MKALNFALLAVFALSVAANFAVRPDPSRPNMDYLPEMVDSVAYDSFAPNPNFPDGKTLQRPVEGTVARIEPPRSMTPAASMARGARVFAAFCAVCHGGAGKGDGPVVARGFPAPPSLLAQNAITMTGEQMFTILTAGRRNMPSYAAQVSPEDRRNVILYVRSLQRGAAK